MENIPFNKKKKSIALFNLLKKGKWSYRLNLINLLISAARRLHSSYIHNLIKCGNCKCFKN